MTRGLWLRWSWRDLRRRWPVVTAIALIIALGTGVYAGFTSMGAWRRASNDVNYADLRMYDLRVKLTSGTFAPEGTLRDAVVGALDADAVTGIDERLIMPVQVDASTATRDLLVHGELVGVDLNRGGPSVNRIGVTAGRALGPEDSGRAVAIVHPGFVKANGLGQTGTLHVGGGTTLDYVGLGLAPDYFIIISPAAGFVPLGNLPHYAVLFTSLATAQTALGQPGMVNDLVMTLAPGADRAALRQQLETGLAARLPDVSATVLTTDDDEGYRILYDDIENDQRLVTILAMIVLAGAALAAFNLSSRQVEAQRREIGVGMALGVPPSRLAIRPLLFGAQVAILGVLASIPIGLLVAEAMKPVLEDMVPLPEWQMPFQAGTFMRAAALGFLLPFVATIYPVLRAVSVQPVQAIRAGFLAGGSGGLAPLLRWIPLPGRSVAQMPVRNLLRTPRRTLLTALAIGGSLTALVAMLGLLDSFDRVIEENRAETLRSAPDRLDVQLDFFYPEDGDAPAAIRSAPVTAAADFGLRLEGTAVSAADEFPVALTLLDFADAMWTPAVIQGAAPGRGEVLLTEKAAADLGVRVGERVTLRHPLREGFGYRMVETPFVVSGLHPGALRFVVFLDTRTAAMLGFEGLVNYAQLQPVPGATAESVRRALFGLPGVAYAHPVSETSTQLREAMGQFYDILLIGEVAALAIALLIAFNASSIATDERARDHATMFAFGLPVRSVMLVTMVESGLVGLLSLLIGLPAGFFVLVQLVRMSVADTMPDLAMEPVLASGTVVAAFLIGVVAVAAAPLLTVRRLRRMDIPSMLRVIE